ncbi:hypothetical protein K9M74_01690 [Candidatus Woesearchaeota archaeon]|nr:hypothetical protein [Candidatus Woesearchaeota archaeon]
MVKDALRVTRRFSRLRGRNRAPRPKTFKTKESAESWAKAQGYKEFTVENLKNEEAKTAKFRVIVEL